MNSFYDFAKKFNIVFVILILLNCQISDGEEIKRTHRFIRSMAMSEACTALEGKESIAHNPAGLLVKNGKWSMSFPLIWLTFNDTLKQSLNGSIDIDFNDQEGLEELKGTRVFAELQLAMPFLYFPDSGVFWGVSTDNWIEFIFPIQSIIPMVHLELVNQNIVEYGFAFETFLTGLNFGANIKFVQRIGAIADISLLRAPNLTQEELYQEYSPDPPSPKIILDIGFLYRFDHPLNFRVGISALDIAGLDVGGEGSLHYGSIDYGSVGVVKQFNSVGFAATQELDNLDITYSADFHDFTFNYFPNTSIKRRIALGAEAAFGKNPDDSYLMILGVGLKELEYPSFGFSGKLGVLKISTVQWVENFGTENVKKPDKRYMFQISFDF